MKKKYIIYLSAVALVTVGIILIGWRRRAANIAASFIDEAEIGNNAGFSDAAFQQMMQDVGWLGGEAWCMYFAKAVYLKAFPKRADDINRILNGSTQQSWKNAIANPDVFKVITDGKPQKGDIAIYQSTGNPSTGHAALVYQKDSGDTWYTVEGNSGFGGTREGQGVTKGDRLLVPGTVDGDLKLLGFMRMRAQLFN